MRSLIMKKGYKKFNKKVYYLEIISHLSMPSRASKSEKETYQVKIS